MKLDQIAPITELKLDAAALIEQAQERGAPIIITQNGRATAVLQDAKSYEDDRQAFALLKLAVQGEEDIAQGKHLTLAEHRQRMKTLLRERGAK